MEPSNNGMNVLGRKHHDGERGHKIIGHLILPHNHRSNSQDDNIGSTIDGSERLDSQNAEKGLTNPTTGSGTQRMPLLERMKTLNPTEMIERLKSRSSLNLQRPSEDMNHLENTDTRLGSELEENESSGARSHKKINTHNQGPYKEHEKGHYPGHDKKHHPWQGHGQDHHPGHGQDHHQGHIMQGHRKGHRGVWPTHRSSELENTETNNSSRESTMVVNPGFENEMLGESMNFTGSGIEGSKNFSEGSTPSNSEGALETQAREDEIPIKFNVGARANELIQQLKERQEMRKANLKSALQTSRSSLSDSVKPLEGMVATTENSGGQPNSVTKEMGKPVGKPEVNNFENAEAALEKVRDLSNGLQEITVTNKPSQIEVDVTTPKVISDIEKQGVNTIEDDSVKLIVEPNILKSQPLDDSFERIQPTTSLFGTFSRRKNSEQETKQMVGDPYVGSANPVNVLKEQNQNEFMGFETVGDTNPAVVTRGKFENDPNAFSNSMGAIVPAENPTDASFHQKPSDVYFLGNGIKLPLKMVKDNKGVMHLSVDLDKLCSCNNITCPKNHTVLEKAVETILENETELKEKLEPIKSAGNEPRNGNYEDMTVGMALPQGMLEDESSIRQQEMQSRMRGFEDETALESSPGVSTSHRNERDTVEKEKFPSRNKITDSFDSMELQRDNAGILKRSPEVKSAKISPNSLSISDNPSVRTSRNFENKQKNNTYLLKEIHMDDGSNISETTKTTPSETTTKAVIIKNSSLEPNYLQDFMNKRLDDIRSKLNIRNDEMKKDLTFPEYFFKNLWTAGKQQAEKILPNFNVDNTSPTLGSRIGSLLDKTAAANDEMYENLALINKPYKFKTLENQLKTNLAHIGTTVDDYNKKDEEILKEEVAALEKINENPVVKKEVGIVSNILKFFKGLASDKNKNK
nr:uncharacterized protein LOC111505563 [Leptinotarsa decemlineata]